MHGNIGFVRLIRSACWIHSHTFPEIDNIFLSVALLYLHISTNAKIGTSTRELLIKFFLFLWNSELSVSFLWPFMQIYSAVAGQKNIYILLRLISKIWITFRGNTDTDTVNRSDRDRQRGTSKRIYCARLRFTNMDCLPLLVCIFMLGIV